jgi:hypothetical protein
MVIIRINDYCLFVKHAGLWMSAELPIRGVPTANSSSQGQVAVDANWPQDADSMSELSMKVRNRYHMSHLAKLVTEQSL